MMMIKKSEHKVEHRTEAKPAAKAEPVKAVVNEHVNPGPIPPASNWQDSVRPDKPHDNLPLKHAVDHSTSHGRNIGSNDKPHDAPVGDVLNYPVLEDKPHEVPAQHDHVRITQVISSTFHDLGNAAADCLAHECSTHEGRKAFYAGDGVARATALRDQALALAARFSAFIRA